MLVRILVVLVEVGASLRTHGELFEDEVAELILAHLALRWLDRHINLIERR